MAKPNTSKKSDGEWITLGSLNKSKSGNALSFRADTYKGKLLYSTNDGKLYEINSGLILDPHEKAPKFVQKVIRLNLKDEQAAKLLGEDE